MQPFFDKLNSGKPVTVLAFGDSITKDLGEWVGRDVKACGCEDPMHGVTSIIYVESTGLI
jgi:hypothetical protein